MSAVNEADVHATTPRVRATDAGDRWEWTNAAGRLSTRDKATTPELPAVVTEVAHGRRWAREADSTRGILLLPPLSE